MAVCPFADDADRRPMVLVADITFLPNNS